MSKFFSLDGVNGFNLNNYQLTKKRLRINLKEYSFVNAFDAYKMSVSDHSKSILEFLAEEELDEQVKSQIRRMRWKNKR